VAGVVLRNNGGDGGIRELVELYWHR